MTKKSVPPSVEELESAARAIGGIYDAHTGSITFDGGLNYDEWDPSDYDCDALQLAIKLKFEIRTYAGKDWVTINDGRSSLNNIHTEMHNGDPFKATRYAIVRAAACYGVNK